MLNFDPHRFLAEQAESVASVAIVAEPSCETPVSEKAEPPATLATVATTRPDAGTARATVRRWRAGLSGLEVDQPLGSVEPRRWARLAEDAFWIFENHAEELAAEGWSDLDVFGVSLRRPAGEVLLDRLDGSRRLHLDGKGRAAWGWSYTSVIMQACRGYAGLQPDWAIIPLWEMK